MTTSDLTTELLKQIRDGVYENTARIEQTRIDLTHRLDQTNEHLDQTNVRLSQTNERLDRTRSDVLDRIAQTNERLDRTRSDVLDRIDQTNERLDQNNERLDRLEVGVSTLVGHVSNMADRETRIELDVEDLRRRVELLESRSTDS